MCLLVGHNDAGFEPDEPPLIAPDLNTAIVWLKKRIGEWFAVVLCEDNLDVTIKDVREFQHTVFSAEPGSRFVFHGHVFWVRLHDDHPASGERYP